MSHQDDHPSSPAQLEVPITPEDTLETEQSQIAVHSDDQGFHSLAREEGVPRPSPVEHSNAVTVSPTGTSTATGNHDPHDSLSNVVVHPSTTNTHSIMRQSNPELKGLGTNTIFAKLYQPTSPSDDHDDNDDGNHSSQTPAAQWSTRDGDSSLSSPQHPGAAATSKQPKLLSSPIESLTLVNFGSSHPDNPDDKDSVSSIQSAGSFIGPTIDRHQHGHAQARITESVRFEYNQRMSLVRDMQTGRESTRGSRAVRLDGKGAGSIRRRRQQQQQQQTRDDRGALSIRSLRDNDGAVHDRISHVSWRGRFVANRMTPMAEDVEECFQDDNSDLLAPRNVVKQPVQYRLEAFDSKVHGPLSRALGRRINSTSHEDSVRFEPLQKVYGFRPNLTVARYLNWTFRTSFFMVSLSACAAYFAITLTFAAAIVVIGHAKPDCIQVAGQPFSSDGAFLDAYALSWTTFSTVGYGAIFPGISTASSNIMTCTGITILTTLESFVGILFSSFWAAVFYAKVGRVASFAPVEFCDPLVIRYGVGVMTAQDESSDEETGSLQGGKRDGDGNDDGSDSHESETMDKSFHFVPSKFPCPVLEFRVVNHRWARLGGEIIEATLNAVASIDESQLSEAVRSAMRGPRRRGKKGRRRLGLQRPGEGAKDDALMPPTRERLDKAKKDVELMINKRRTLQAIRHYPTGLLPKKIFTKLEIQSYDHPFFKRLWLVRHSLDQYSPLLRPEAKELIRLNGGHWPMELNSAEAVRASVCFDQIVVSLSGISNADANSVYKQKVYDYVDVCVGYQFSDMLFRQHDGSIGVDTRLLNDVKEQRGGGGEDLHAPTRKDHYMSDDVLIL